MVKTHVPAFSPLVDKAFQKWIANDTWRTGHPSDDERFYRFVWAVISFSRRHVSESDLQNLIMAKWRGKLEDEYLQYKAIYYSGLYASLLEFVKIRKKPRLVLFSEDGMPIFD